MPDKTIRWITKIMQREIATEGYNWKNVPSDVKLRYWEEFQKVYTWDPIFSTNIVMELFFVHAADRYGGMVSKAKTDFRHTPNSPDFVSRETWDSWLRYWNDPDVEAKSQQASKNRLSSDGTGCSKHTGGSRSAVSYEKAYREQHGKDPDMVNSFLTLHTRKDGSFIDEKSKRIVTDVESRISAAADVGEEVDVNKVFISAVGGVKKRCLYGVGSLKHKYIGSHSTSPSASSVSLAATLRTQVEQLTQQLAERDAKLAERDANLQQALEAERAARTEMHASMQAQMEQFMEQLRRQGGPPSQP